MLMRRECAKNIILRQEEYGVARVCVLAAAGVKIKEGKNRGRVRACVGSRVGRVAGCRL